MKTYFSGIELLSQEPKPFKKIPEPIKFETMVNQFKEIENLLKEYEDPSKVFENKKEFDKFLVKLPNDSWRSLLTFMKRRVVRKQA